MKHMRLLPPRRGALRVRPLVVGASLLTAAELMLAGATRGQGSGPADFPNSSGVMRTIAVGSSIDATNPFFLSLGTNGRGCVTCHEPRTGWTITPENVQGRFVATQGLDPIFRVNDGANAPNADVSTVEKRRESYSMLLTKGLIRVGLPVPSDADFDLVACEDPYNYASAHELSLFRRPLPSTNLRFISAVMWDGRETLQPMVIQPLGVSEESNAAALLFDLMRQSNSATRGHAQAASDLADEQKRRIVAFEMSLFTAQASELGAGALDTLGAVAGPATLMAEPFYIGINDNVSDPRGPFVSDSMRLFTAWLSSDSPYRRAIARGEQLFNRRSIRITGVKGLNDNAYFGKPQEVIGSCTTCHNAPNVGNHSLSVPLDIGVSDASRRTQDLPLYTLCNKSTGETVQTTDPGRALISGKWADIGKFKGPILRGLAARAPYFHNGSAATLEDVIGFYDTRFSIGLTAREKADLVAFLKAL